MNKILSFVFFLLLAKVHAQDDYFQYLTDEIEYQLIETVSELKDPDLQLKEIDKLLKSQQISSAHNISSLYLLRAKTTYSLYMKHGGDDNLDMEDKLRLYMLKDVLADYKKAIDLDAYYEPLSRKLRMDLLASQSKKNDLLYTGDLQYLKEHGYKEEREGLGLSVNFAHGKTNLLGAELALLSTFWPSYHLRNLNPEDGQIDKLDFEYPSAIQGLIWGYNQNLNSLGTHEFTFSLFHMTAPILLDFSKLGFTVSPLYHSASWFYRPEIGIGWNWIAIGYGYNFVFSKSDRKQADTHMFLIKFSYPLLKWD
jgi:hypothetical protein